MLKTIFVASIVCLATHALAADPTTSKSSKSSSSATSVSSSSPVKLAKGPGKGGKGGKGSGKDKDKGQEKPENAKADPRTTGAAPVEASSSAPAAAPIQGPPGEARRGMSRIEFDDRLVQGQTNKANAIYLFERRESSLRSLLKKRTDFHEEIDETLE